MSTVRLGSSFLGGYNHSGTPLYCSPLWYWFYDAKVDVTVEVFFYLLFLMVGNRDERVYCVGLNFVLEMEFDWFSGHRW